MNTKLPCSVTRDLLPLYAEKMVEEETEELIRAHLADCPECSRKMSEIKTEAAKPIEGAKPLQSLKREIGKRRWFTAAVAALCVFIAVFTFFYHRHAMRPVPWEEGLIEVVGIERRPREELPGEEKRLPDDPEALVQEKLVLRVSSRINGYRENSFTDEDGKTTVLLEGWSSHPADFIPVQDYSESEYYPVPDRLIYAVGDQQHLLWGEPMNGGVEVLPRLALGYYMIAAVAGAALTGLLWFMLRKHKYSWIARQVFFAPLSYLAAHLLIKGFQTATFFMERDFVSITLIALALYALLTLGWQIWLQRRKEKQ